MKKTAVLIYDSFCNFEFSVLMEIFAINNKSVTIFAKETLPLKSEEGFERESLEKMTDWNENLKNPISEGYIKEGNIITSVSYNFIEWSIAVAEELGLNVKSKWFGK